MRLSTKGRYAVTAMLDLAIHDGKKAVTLADISQCQVISLAYLEQLFAKLRKAGLVTGTRGPGGGYVLAKPKDEISIAQVIQAVDENLDVTKCNSKADCRAGERCLTHELWNDLSGQIYLFLDEITLAQFVGRPSIQALVKKQLVQ